VIFRGPTQTSLQSALNFFDLYLKTDRAHLRAMSIRKGLTLGRTPSSCRQFLSRAWENFALPTNQEETMNTAFSCLRPLRFFLVPCALFLTLGCQAAKKETKKEREIPDADTQAQKKKEIQDLFKNKDYSSAEYFEKGIQTKDDPPGRYVLLEMARDKAAEEFECTRAYQAVDELAKSFDDVDALEMKKDVLGIMAKSSKTPEDYYDVTDYAVKLIPRCVDADKYDAANALLALTDETRKKAKPGDDQKELETKVAAERRKVQEVQKEFEEAKASRETLETKSDDKEANLTWGKFVCTIKGQWDKGLPMLEKSGDEKWTPVAKMDLDKPAGGDAQVKVGDKWWELAQPEQGLARNQLKARAVFWYKKAENSVSGLTQERIKKCIREVEGRD
jgi:hypothetical protein